MSRSSPPKQIAVAITGVGLVGSEFIRQLLSLQISPNPFRIVSLSSSKHTLFDPKGLSITPETWKEALQQSSSLLSTLELKSELVKLTSSSSSEGQTQQFGEVVFVDNTSSEEVASLYPAFLANGVHVITPNKKAFSGGSGLFGRILDASRAAGTRFLNESTVGAGLPVVQTLKDLVATGDKILKIEGVFSGTFSYIFNNFSTAKEGGPSFSAVVKDARAKGYTEPHPADDLTGSDVARKLTILTRTIPSLQPLIPLPQGFHSVSTSSLIPDELLPLTTSGKDADEFCERLEEYDGQFDGLRAEALKEGNVLRYVGVIDAEKGLVRASLEKYPVDHPFATSLGGSDNIIMFHTERYSPRPLIVQGAGAGAAVTAMGVLSDLLKLL